MDKKYIQEYGKLETSHWWFIVRQKIILQTIQKFIPKEKAGRLKILNVGIAAGASSLWLSQLGDVVSVENDPLFLEYLHSKNIPVIDASVTSLPFDAESFDLVCAFDVIEHVNDHKKAIEELLRVCRTDGKVCITVPAFQSLWGSHDEVNDHKRRYIRKTLFKLFPEKKSILYSTYFNTILFLPAWIFRKTSLLFSRKSKQEKSDFTYFSENGFSNKILKAVFGIEPSLLKWMTFPYGISLITIVGKGVPSSRKNKK